MIEITLQELKNPWTEESPLKEILSIIDQNSFANFHDMEFDVTLEWIPYNIKKAFQILKRRKKTSAEFRTQEPFSLRCTISKNPLQNTVKFIIHDKYLKENDINSILNLINKLAMSFPKFHWGVANPDVDISEFYDSQDLPWVPECFIRHVSWFHLISPIGFEKYFDREDLLDIPAYEVLEWENGIIQIMTFEDPLAFDTEENRQRIIEITNYLNERRKDWKQ